jgi:hypothetical protein
LLTIQPTIKDAPTAILVNEPTAYLWSVYYLRNSITKLWSYQSYFGQAHVSPYLAARSQKVDDDQIKYLLTDAISSLQSIDADKIWQNEIYALWQIKDNLSVIIANISNPNGLETVNNEPFFWIGNQSTQITIFSRQAGSVEISAEFLPGPSISNTTERNVSIKTDKGFSEKLNIIETQKIILPVTQGLNKITIRGLDQPTILRFDNGDTRPLLIGVRQLRVQFKSP